MNPVDGGEALALVKGLLPVASTYVDRVEVALFPPFPWLLGVAEVLDQTGVKLGAQDCFWETSGAYTGEVSPAMLKGWCQWVIIGHSERRAYLGETDDMVARKVAAALSTELSVIMCVGELDELLHALREVSAGRSVVDSGVVERLVDYRSRQAESPLRLLSEREVDVLREMAEGKSNSSIASGLHLSESSVEKYVNTIFSKLGLSEERLLSRRVAAVLAYLRAASTPV